MQHEDPVGRQVSGYSDAEILASGVFEYVKAGYTYPEAVEFAGLDKERFELNMRDVELRYHILLCSMTTTAYEGRARRKFASIINVLTERADHILRRAA